MASHAHTPLGRGFDNGLIFFGGAQDHYSNCNCVDPTCAVPNNGYISAHNHSVGSHCWKSIVNLSTQKPAPWPSTAVEMTGQGYTDLWRTSNGNEEGPAYGLNNTLYSGHLWTEAAVKAIEDSAAEVPLFMYIALPCNHSPLQVPVQYMDLYDEAMFYDKRRMLAMSSFWDEAVFNITSALKSREGFWEKTLFVLSGDNGGPVYWGSEHPPAVKAYPHGGSASNYPNRGGKSSPFEGATRVSAFVAGGMLPPKMHGRVLNSTTQIIHVADWYQTFCTLAGVDYLDSPPGLPSNVDSLDVWPLLSGTSPVSPRTETPLAIEGHPDPVNVYGNFSIYNQTALIVGEFKAIFGLKLKSNFWQGPDFPNATYQAWAPTEFINATLDCGALDGPGGCLFNIEHDQTEHVDLAKKLPAKLEELRERAKQLRNTVYNPDRCFPYTPETNCAMAQFTAAVEANKMFAAPYMP